MIFFAERLRLKMFNLIAIWLFKFECSRGALDLDCAESWSCFLLLLCYFKRAQAFCRNRHEAAADARGKKPTRYFSPRFLNKTEASAVQQEVATRGAGGAELPGKREQGQTKGAFNYSGLSSPPTKLANQGMERAASCWRLEVVLQVWTLLQVWSHKSVTFRTYCSLTWSPASCIARCFHLSSWLPASFIVTFTPVWSLFILKYISTAK